MSAPVIVSARTAITPSIPELPHFAQELIEKPCGFCASWEKDDQDPDYPRSLCNLYLAIVRENGWSLMAGDLAAVAGQWMKRRKGADLDAQESKRAWAWEKELLDREIREAPGNAGEAASSITYLDLEKIARDGIPPMRWILPGWLAEQDIAIIAGAAGIGKSTTVAALALALASGEPWCGIEPIEPVSVLYFDEEQGDDTTARLFLRLGKPHPNLRVASSQGINLATTEGIARLEQTIIEHKAKVVFFDSVQQTFVGVPGNDNQLVGAVYRSLQDLRDRHKVVFVLVHHERKPAPEMVRFARATASLASVRDATAHTTQTSTVWVTYRGPGDSLDLKQVKRRGGRQTSLRIGYAEDGTEGPITLTGQGTVEEEDSAQDRAENFVVDYLEERDQARTAEIQGAAEGQNHRRSTITQALNHLLETGAIHRPGKGLYRPGRAPENEALKSLLED